MAPKLLDDRVYFENKYLKINIHTLLHEILYKKNERTNYIKYCHFECMSKDIKMFKQITYA